MAGNSAIDSLDTHTNVAEFITNAINTAIIADGNAKMVKAAHKLVGEVVHDFETRLREMVDTIRKDTQDKLESERQRYTLEKDSAVDQDTKKVKNGLFAFSTTVLLSQYLKSPQLISDVTSPNVQVFGRTAGSPELGSTTPTRGAATLEIPKRANPLGHGKHPPAISDHDSDDDMPLSRKL